MLIPRTQMERKMVDDTQTTTTEVKTMWSETLLESLYVALQKNKEDVLKEVLDELKAKGYKNDYLIEKVQKKVGPNAAVRLKSLLPSGGKKSVQSGQSRLAASKKKPGMFTKIKGIFK